MLRNFALLLALTSLSACGGTPPLGGSPNVSIVDGSTLPEPATVTGAAPYSIGPFDVLTVGVFGIESLQPRDIQVDGEGMISFPMVGPLHALDKTPRQLEAEIAQGLRAFVRDPQVTVNLKEMNSHTVTVDGQVREPGLYPAVEGITLMRAVAQARGLAEFAKQDDVVIFRTVNGQRYAALYNLSAIRRGAYDDPRLFADDVVVVGNSQARQLFRDMLQLVPLLSGPLIIALQNS